MIRILGKSKKYRKMFPKPVLNLSEISVTFVSTYGQRFQGFIYKNVTSRRPTKARFMRDKANRESMRAHVSVQNFFKTNENAGEVSNPSLVDKSSNS